MVGTAIGIICLLLLAFVVGRQRLTIDSLREHIAQRDALISSLTTAVEDWRKLHDFLMEKIEARANLTPPPKKEDDSVIHARNAGDVRRQFEKAVGGLPNVHE